MSDDDQISFEYNDKGLKDLIKAFTNPPKVKIGVLGDKISRTKDLAIKGGEAKLTNAEIGAIHEYGTSQTPQRSFLRQPITENLQEYLEQAGAFTKESVINIMREKSLIGFMKKVGLTAERIVQDGFDSGGFGKWPPSDMRRKKNKQTLVETQQLRNSITSEVIK